MKKLFFFIFVSFFWLTLCFAQSPQAIRYQAVARDAQGQVLNNKLVSVKVTILKGSINGSVVYEETHTKTTNNFGLVNLDLGRGVPLTGLFSNIEWYNDSYFIRIAIDITGNENYVFSGIAELLSVPYAFYADRAGNPGITGPTGDTGPQGLKGATGEKGDTGPQGLKGATGEKGDTGPQGLKGTTGEKGDTGPQGLKGATGEKGDTGPQGLKGTIGEKGDTGPQGLKGNTGEKGDTGPQGLKGNTGEKGDTGPQGLKGTTGEKGDTGPQGLKGTTGEKGDTGPQGLQGITGATGPIAGSNKQFIFNDNSNPAGTQQFIFDKVTGNIALGTNEPSPSAFLEINSTNKGFLLPRMTDPQRNAINNPVDGLAIFNITTGCLNFYKNISWFEICGSNTMPVPTAGSNSPICSGETLKLTAKTIAGATYYWTGPNNFVSTSQNPQIKDATTLASGNYTVKASIGNNSNTSTTTIVVNPLLPVSIIINSDKTTICNSETVIFSATPTNGGNNPKYQWKNKGNNIQGATNSIYSSNTLINNDVITCELTSNITPCPTNNPALSNSITITVNPLLPVSIIINADKTTICSGETVKFTATPENGGTNPKYQWKKNNINITNATKNSYSSDNLANNDKITCVLTSNAEPCATENPATSNQIKITVNPLMPVSVNIQTNNTTICSGTNTIFTATANNGGAAPSYQWIKNNNNIDDATNSSYSTTTLTDKDTITCLLTSNITCPINNPALSNKIGMNIIPIATQAVAGEDQIDIDNLTITLDANIPSVGTGLWSKISGIEGKIQNPSDPKSTFTGIAGQTYVLRWTISNNCGGTFDDITISFKAQFVCGNNFTDIRDNKVYRTVLIGKQCWFKDNLNIGTFINSVNTNYEHVETSNNQIIEKYCYNNLESNCVTLGGLYDWNELMNYSTIEKSQGICPDGWHIPTDTEFKTLEIFLGMSTPDANSIGWRGSISSKFKQGGSSGFDCLFAGKRNKTGNFSLLNTNGIFWTSTISEDLLPYYRNIEIGNIMIGREDTDRTFAISVRCVKN